MIAALAGTVIFFSPLFTHYIESNGFRVAMENETAKGLHFPNGRYAPIRRTGSLTAQSENFQASNGERALKSLDAHGISARFNPWGMFVRQWRFSDVHVRSGDVEIQIYEANPEAIEPKPWFAIFLPNRVFLKRIESEHSNVIWRFRGEPAGFFGTQLLITPHGPDFEYRATGGTLKMALLPGLYLRGAHLLVTSTLLTIYDVNLAPDETSDGSIHGQGTSGIGKDKSVDFKANFDRVPIRTWLSGKWKGHLSGSAFGDVHWAGENPKLESSSGEGSFRVRDARIENLPLLEKLAELERRMLRGAIKLGVAQQYLDWLPKPEEVFTTKRSGYLWTTVHLSGTVDEPKQDLSPRIVELFKESPGAYLGLLFRQFEAWLEKIFRGD